MKMLFTQLINELQNVVWFCKANKSGSAHVDSPSSSKQKRRVGKEEK